MTLSNAERQARWRQRREQRIQDIEKRAPHGDTAALAAAQAENVALKARIAALEAEKAARAQRGSKPEPPPLPESPEAWDAMKARAKERGRQPRAAAPRPVNVLPETEAVARLQKQLAAAHTRISNLLAKVRVLSFDAPVVMSRKLHRELRACLHPDWVTDPKQKARYEEATKQFNALKIKFPD